MATERRPVGGIYDKFREGAEVRVATWNLERLDSRARRDRVLGQVDEVAADVWVFTETDHTFAPTGAQHLHCSGIEQARARNERWVSIASTHPLEPLVLTGDPVRSVAARVHPAGRDPFVVFGTVLPWTSDRWRGLRGVDAFVEAVAVQRADLQRLRAENPRSDFIWAGDFNQHLGEGARYWSSRNHALLVETLDELGLSCLTSDPDPVAKVAPARRSVDHICVALADRWARGSVAVWPVSATPDRRLSDHYGVAVDTWAP
jgi:endonuclease/exonuclease/phosphatase family metal-dependent hydrolase